MQSSRQEHKPKRLVFYSDTARNNIWWVIDPEIQEKIRKFVRADEIMSGSYSTHHVSDRMRSEVQEGFRSGIHWSVCIRSMNIVAVVLVSVNDACVLGVGKELENMGIKLYRYVDENTLELITKPKLVGKRKIKLK